MSPARTLFRIVPFLAASLAAPSAFAQTVTPAWTGEGALNAGVTTGNTETTDIGLALKLRHAGAQWAQSGEFSADYGETEDVESKNRLAAAGQVDRFFSERLSGYVRLTWEQDEFSGFEQRYFAGVGAAWKTIDTENTKWTIEGGPGYRVEEIRATGETEENLGARAGSRFSHAFNENVSVSNNTEAVYSDTSTQITNTVALTANLMGNLSARLSLDVRHDTDPPPGFEATDTATKASLVYKIG